MKKIFEQINSGSLRQLPVEVTAKNAPEGDAKEHFKAIVNTFEIASSDKKGFSAPPAEKPETMREICFTLSLSDDPESARLATARSWTGRGNDRFFSEKSFISVRLCPRGS